MAAAVNFRRVLPTSSTNLKHWQPSASSCTMGVRAACAGVQLGASTHLRQSLHACPTQSLMAEDSFQHILRVLNTNVDGKQKIMYALTSIKGLGRRFANLACKKAEIDMRKRYVTVICSALIVLQRGFVG